jgi:hypothetical protein
MNKIFKQVAVLAFAGLTAISFQGVAQRHGGGGGGSHGGGGGGGRGGFGGGGHASAPSRSSFGGGGHVNAPSHGGFGGGQSARSFTPRSSGGGFNRTSGRGNAFHGPSPIVRGGGYTRGGTTVRSGGFGRTSVRGNTYRPMGGSRTVYNSHTTVVNRGYVHGGYYGSPHMSYYHPSRPVGLFGHPRYGYSYHSYRPYYWGPSYHPIGFFTGALLGAAISLSWQNHPYRYYNGVYYEPYNSGYRVIAPPVGIRISTLPAGFSEIPVEGTNFYYYGGTFYRNYGNDYGVVEAPYGAVVYNLPDGAQEVTVNGNRYMFYNNTYYQPFDDNGTDAYEVVDVREQ